MEQSSQMSAEQSLKLINETLRDSRLVITKRSGSHFILWGAILTLIQRQIQRQISCNNQNDKKTRVNTNIYSI